MRALILAIIALSVVTGCGKKERERGSVRVRGADETAPATGGTGTIVPGAPFQKLFGNITGYTTANVQALVSATPEIVMELDSQGRIPGIAFSGDMKLSTSSQDIRALGSGTASIASGSELTIFILDNLTVTNNVKAITIGFKPGQNGYQVSGSINAGTVNMTFHDQYGDIMLNGTYNANNFNGDFTGTVSFKNLVGSSANQTITLGTFKVPTCGFFHCQ